MSRKLGSWIGCEMDFLVKGQTRVEPRPFLRSACSFDIGSYWLSNAIEGGPAAIAESWPLFRRTEVNALGNPRHLKNGFGVQTIGNGKVSPGLLSGLRPPECRRGGEFFGGEQAQHRQD
jgi:hypothetical protein